MKWIFLHNYRNKIFYLEEKFAPVSKMVMSFLLFASIAKSYRIIISTFKVASTLFPETFCACIREQIAHFLIKNFCNKEQLLSNRQLLSFPIANVSRMTKAQNAKKHSGGAIVNENDKLSKHHIL